jgi:hypothetical protein
MAEEKVTGTEADTAPALPDALITSPANCTGELVQLPTVVEGLTYNSYECQTCHQVVHVGHEDLEANGLPPEHSPVIL